MSTHITKALAIAGLALAATTITSCSDAPKGDKAAITTEQSAAPTTGSGYVVDTAASSVRFTGRGVGKNHSGKFHLSSGDLAVAGNTVTGGTFVININSIDLEQKGEMFQNKLQPHLLSGDFFDAAKFGTAKFEITKVAPFSGEASLVAGANYNVSGNLTLKDVTKNITFPAKIDLDGTTLKAKANFDIDRTQWQMNYGSDKTLGDKFINEKVNIELDLQAKKQ